MSLPKLFTIIIVLSFWFAVAVAQEVPRLELGKVLEREIAGRQTHEYQVTLADGLIQISEITARPEFKEGQRLVGLDTQETLRAAILKFEEARRIAQRLGSKAAEATCLVAIGETYIQLGESGNAIARYNEALAIYQSIPDNVGVGTMRSRIAMAPLESLKASAKRQRKAKKMRVHPELIVQTGHTNSVNCIAFSPDGKLLASGSGDKTIKLWDVVSGKELRTLAGHSADTISVAFSPDGKLLASGSFDKTVKLWDVTSGKELSFLVGHADRVTSVAFSPDGKLLASGSRDKTIKLWDVTNGQELRTLTGHEKSVASVAFTPDGKILASGSDDKTIKLWEIATGQERRTFSGHAGSVFLNVGSSPLALSPDGKLLASVGSRPEGDGQRIFDGSMLANGGTDNIVKIWDVTAGRELPPFIGHTNGVASVAYSPDGKLLASGSFDKTVKLWDVISGKELHTHAGHAFLVWDVVFSPDGKLLASGSADQRIKLWDVSSGQELRTFAGHAGVVLAFSPDGRLLAAGGGTGKILKLWEVATGQLLHNLSGTGFESITFSPDGRTLASNGSGVLKLWDIAIGQELPLPDKLPDWVRQFLGGEQALINGKMIRADNVGARIDFVDTATELPLASLIALDEKDWVVVDGEGRFDASDGALQLMHYAYGLDIIGFDQLKDEYYEPNLLQKLLGYNTEPLRAVVPLQDVKLPPEVREQSLSPDGKRLTLKLANRGGGIGKTEIFLNGKLVIPDARTATLRQNPNVLPNEVVTLTVDLPVTSYLPGKENQIKVVTSNYLAAIKRGNIQSSARGVAYLDRRKSEDTLPSVYALVSGVSDYEGDALDLRFAAKDAEDFSTALALGARRLFCPPGNLQCLDKVNITTLSTNRTKAEEQPTKENFKRALGAIAAKAKPEDIVVIYLAGHGVSLGVNTDTYFYLTKEAKSVAREDLSKNYQTVAISSEELRDWLTQTEWRAGVKGLKPLKQVLILDTCAAGTAASQLALTTKRELSGDQIRAIEFLKDKTGTFVLMGSAADAPSYEASRYGQGLLTYALLQGMKGAALDKSEYVDVQTLFSYAQKEVPRMAANIGGIQRPIISAPLGRTFVIGQMTEAEKSQVRLSSPKPLLLRPLLTNPETGDDDLKLIPALRKRFDAESSYEMMKRSGKGEPTLVYVDDDSFPEALRLTGTYTVVGDKVRVMAFLRRDGKTVAMLAEIVTTKEMVVDELVKAVRKALGQLRE